MKTVRSLSSLTVCLCVQLSVCLLGSTSGSTSLWGKKLRFSGRPCVWQLQPDVVIPALKDLSVCLLLRQSYATKWTGFVYKAPGGRHVELGLGGTGAQLSVWLFGVERRLTRELELNEWHSICLTWSGKARRLRIYVNGNRQDEFSVDANQPQQLAPNGTLTLGASHDVDANGSVQPETGSRLLGDISLFRMWAKEWSDEELRRHGCADGDVVSWDLQQWNYTCPPVPDDNLYCEWSNYKIKMWAFIEPENCSVPLEKITKDWLRSVFPRSVSVQSILVSSRSRTCPHVKQPQESRRSSHSDCEKCFSCEVSVNVAPAASVEVVQSNIPALLISTFSHDFLTLTVDPNSISVRPAGPSQNLPARPTYMSTAGEPRNLNKRAISADTFFRVNVTLSMTGSPTNPQRILAKWLKVKLEANFTMVVLNLVITENVGRNTEKDNIKMTLFDQRIKYNCTFHVQEYNINSIADVIMSINAALTSKYEDDFVVIETTDVSIKLIMPGNCLEEITKTIYGEYIWPETFPKDNQVMGCKKPSSQRAYRDCELHIETDTAGWAPAVMTNCEPMVIISDLDNITVTTDNADDVVGMVQDLVNDQLVDNAELSSSELDTVVEKLNQVVDISVIEPAVGADIIKIVANILVSKTDVAPVANNVLHLTDRMANNMHFPGESVSFTAPSVAMSMVNVDPDGFSGFTFAVSSLSSLQEPNISFNQNFVSEPLADTDVSISLPSALQDFLRNRTRVQFQFYGTPDLFQDPGTYGTQSNWTVNSYIVSASVNDSQVSDLSDRVVVTLGHRISKQPGDHVKCMFWDFKKNGGHGGWNSRGCETRSVSSNKTICLCDHLTHFAVLLDVSRTPIGEADSQILTVISYIGCGISSIFLSITLLTYLAFEKLRRDYPSKILINLTTALLGLCMVFLLDSWLSSFSNYSLCISTAAALHYFLLASFTWMGLEAVHMYLALVKVFNTYIPSYILKLCAVGWGVPLVIVSLVLIIDKDAYGSGVSEEAVAELQSTDSFCWLQNDVFFYVTVVTFVLIILLGNVCMFIVVLIKIKQMRVNKLSEKSSSSTALQELRTVASLTVLLGLTWSMGFFSFGPGRVVLMYLFSIFNTLQGLFVFVFHCLMKENVRTQWRIHLCCGRFRLSDYSGCSQSLTAGGGRKKRVTSVASDTTTTMKVSECSVELEPSDHKGA